MRRASKRAVTAAGACALVLPMFALTANATGSAGDHSRSALPGSTPTWATSANGVGAAKAATPIQARVYLAARGGEARLNAAVAAVSTPGSPQYRHFLTPAQYRAQYEPTSTTVAAVKSWLSGAGMTVTGVGPDNRYVAASGQVADAQAAFGVSIRLYRHNGKVEQAPTANVTVPSGLSAQVLGVTGLDTPQAIRPVSTNNAPPPAGFRNARPCSAYFGQLVATRQANNRTPLPKFHGVHRFYAVCGYTPSQFRGAYGVTGSGLSGAGATVAIVDAYAAPTIRRDANQYARTHGDPGFAPGQFTQSMPGQHFRLGGQCGPSGWYGEETLDVEATHAIATGANVRYYASRSCFDTDFLDTLGRVVDENQASIVSNSWGEPSADETSNLIRAYEQVFKQGAMQGIGFMFSSGDSGDDVKSTGLKQTDYPTSDPYVTSVGGTSAAINKDNSMYFQTGWGTNKYSLSADGKSWVPIASNPFLYGAGGGFSNLFNRPVYQHGVVPDSSPAGRAVPDIAMDADPTTGMLVGETQTFPEGRHYGEYRIGGTSLASPLMAGMQALAAQKAGGRLGFANPRIYALARHGSAGFTDINRTNDVRANVRPDYVNGLDPSAGIVYSIRTFSDDASLQTVAGWDDVTGVGTPNARYFKAVSR
ncbi:MAG: S53 family peptidase [Nocardioidaceae bacterium]